jgi:hypothetical protein
MSTSDTVFERALALAVENGDEERAVSELRQTALGRRVALVMAKQRIESQSDDLAADVAARAVSLLDAAIAQIEPLE